MSSNSRYEYDENSETWPYFVLTAVLVPLVPVTLSSVYRLVSNASDASKSQTFKSIKNWFAPYNEKEIDNYRTSQKKSKLFNKRNFSLIIGWLIIALLYVKISNTEIKVSENNFDPWKILEISESATEKVIKFAYRKLSLKFHPDKVDTSKMSQSEIDAVDAAYVLINKAYKALTDETVRENFLKYGNPDGPNEIKHGIALPKFLIDGPTSPFLVLVYVLLIAVILPLLVSNWWNGVKSHTKQGINVNTADHFMKIMMNASPTKLLSVDDILENVSHSVEYLEIDSKLKPNKVHEYLKSYINREKSNNENLRLKIVSITPKLLTAFIEIAAAFKNTDYCLAIVDSHRSIIQALNIEKDSKSYKFQQILQLPNVDSSKVDFTQNILTLGKLLKKPTIEPSKFLGTDKQTTNNILNYAKSIPLIEPLECKFKVPGEDFIPPSSSAHLSLKFIIKSASHKSKPTLNNFSKKVIETQFNEEESMENLKDPMKVVDEQPILQLDNLPPYFPNDEYIKSNCGWIAFLVAQRDNKIIEIPRLINKVDLSNLKLSQDTYSKSECNISTFKIPLQGPTPPTLGDYHFRLIIRNLVYFGSDLDIPLLMKVEDKPIEKSDKDVYGIEDPDEDSLAGAMAQIRGENVKKIEFENEYESSDEEDIEDEDELWTDIDTDTEVEEDAIEEETK
jgi:translocation protein SEC63